MRGSNQFYGGLTYLEAYWELVRRDPQAPVQIWTLFDALNVFSSGTPGSRLCVTKIRRGQDGNEKILVLLPKGHTH